MLWSLTQEWCGSGSHWTERYALPRPLPQAFPGGQEQTLGEDGSSPFRGVSLRPHPDPEAASSCLNRVPLQEAVLDLGLEWGWGYLQVKDNIG